MVHQINQRKNKIPRDKRQQKYDSLYDRTTESDTTETTQLQQQDRAKTILRGKFTAIQTYIKKQEKYQVNNLTLHLKELEEKNKKFQNQQKEENNKGQSRNKQNRAIKIVRTNETKS